MNHLKIFEQFDEWDPFEEEVKKFQDIKVGDFVICVDGSRNNVLKYGNEYEVIDTKSEEGRDFIRILTSHRLKLDDMFLVEYWWDVVRFKKYQKKNEQVGGSYEQVEDDKDRMSGSSPYWLNEQFEEEESWWDEESPFDNLELKRGDIIFIINGRGRGETGMILDISDNLYGVRNKRMYYACNKVNVRRATKEEEDNFKNEMTNIKNLLW